jgi:hypothetical protein
MSDAIDELLKEGNANTLSLGAIQRHRLLRLTRRYCNTVLWDGENVVTAPATSVIVLNSATAPRVETLISSLHENSIVILPFGENPTFDLIKSKLHAYGSIGSQGNAAPHHIWWGGVKPLSVPTGLYRKEDTLFVSSNRRGFLPAAQLAFDLKRLGLDGVMEGLAPDTTVGAQRSSKIDFIIQQWEQTNRPVFWIAPEATVHENPLLPQSLGCDFAVHMRPSGEMQPGAIFFHQTESARSLLDIWQRLSRAYPDLSEAFLLDQAWTLASSQRQIETAWLPDSYWKAGNSQARVHGAVIQYDPSGMKQEPEEYLTWRCRRARRFGRHQAPEAHLIMHGTAPTRGPITVLIRDVLASNAQGVSGAVEAAAQAFASDSGGFSQMEVVLCAWDDDVDLVMQIDDETWVLVTDPSERLERNAFSQLDISDAITIDPPARHIHAASPDQSPRSIFRLADPSLGAKLKRSGKYPASLLKRPLPMTLNE